MASLSPGEKERVLRALEEDREFRYTLMGLLGFKEILDRITRLEERQQKLEERFAKLEERQQRLEEQQLRLEEEFKKLEERFARIEEKFARLEERQQKLEERFARLEERFARLEERQQRLEERQQKLEERFARIEEELRETRRVVLTIAHRFGVLAEDAFREAMKYVVEDALGAAVVERWVYSDREGFVYGHPSIVEADVVIRDGEHILVEVKSRVSKADVSEIHRVAQLYEKVEGVKPQPVIVGGFIDAEAERLAKRLGVRVVPIITQPY